LMAQDKSNNNTRAHTSCARAPKMNMFSGSISSAISMLAPSMVPMMRPPFRANFMLEVPLASMPAVEMCWDRSDAGMMTSALDTP
jgi:hypothetical protein